MAEETVSIRWEAKWSFTTDDGSPRNGYAASDLFVSVMHKFLADAAKFLGGEDDPRFEPLFIKMISCYKLRSAVSTGITPFFTFRPDGPEGWTVEVTYNADAEEDKDGPGAP